VESARAEIQQLKTQLNSNRLEEVQQAHNKTAGDLIQSWPAYSPDLQTAGDLTRQDAMSNSKHVDETAAMNLLKAQLEQTETELATAKDRIAELHGKLSCTWNNVAQSIAHKRESLSPDATRREPSPDPVDMGKAWDEWAHGEEISAQIRDRLHLALAGVKSDEATLSTMELVIAVMAAEKRTAEEKLKPSHEVQELISDATNKRDTLVAEMASHTHAAIREAADVIRHIVDGTLTIGDDDEGVGYESFRALILRPSAKALAGWKKAAEVRKRLRESAGKAGSPRNKTRPDAATATTTAEESSLVVEGSEGVKGGGSAIRTQPSVSSLRSLTTGLARE